MKTILLILLCSGISYSAEIPTIHFNDRVTWKQIFDSGFRPKHLEGLERNRCVSHNQSFWVQFKDRDLKFKVGDGRVAFSFYYDDFLNMIWHQGSSAITMEEGKRQVDEFKKIFSGYIVQEMTMPRLIDPSGLVDAGNDENNIKARVGEYLILYGFDNSMAAIKPIIPHFYITWGFSGMPDMRLKDTRDVVRPPAGYEWYSLDPKVSTPDPTSKTEQKVSNDNSPTHSKNLPREERKEKPIKVAQTKSFQWLWIFLAAIGALIAGYLVKRRFV